MTVTTEHPRLRPQDLTTFDRSSRDLIKAMEDHGWWGRIGRRGHVIMHAPDGVTTSSVTRNHDNNRRTQRNAWAELNRWLRAQETTHPTEETTMATVYVCPEPDCQETLSSRDALRAHRKEAHRTPEPMRPEMPCPECGEVYWKANALGMHLARMHPDSPHAPAADPQTCERCGKEYRSAASLSQHMKNVHPWGTCPLCGEKVTSEHGLKMHLGYTHPEDKERVLAMPKVAIKATVAAPEAEPAPVTPDPDPEAHNVVLDYLVTVTTGKDAEDMVAAIRAVIAPTLVDEVRRLREHNAKLEEELATLTKAHEDVQARMALLKEALAL